VSNDGFWMRVARVDSDCSSLCHTDWKPSPRFLLHNPLPLSIPLSPLRTPTPSTADPPSRPPHPSLHQIPPPPLQSNPKNPPPPGTPTHPRPIYVGHQVQQRASSTEDRGIGSRLYRLVGVGGRGREGGNMGEERLVYGIDALSYFLGGGGELLR